MHRSAPVPSLLPLQSVRDDWRLVSLPAHYSSRESILPENNLLIESTSGQSVTRRPFLWSQTQAHAYEKMK